MHLCWMNPHFLIEPLAPIEFKFSRLPHPHRCTCHPRTTPATKRFPSLASAFNKLVDSLLKKAGDSSQSFGRGWSQGNSNCTKFFILSCHFGEYGASRWLQHRKPSKIQVDPSLVRLARLNWSLSCSHIEMCKHGHYFFRFFHSTLLSGSSRRLQWMRKLRSLLLKHMININIIHIQYNRASRSNMDDTDDKHNKYVMIVKIHVKTLINLNFILAPFLVSGACNIHGIAK